MLVVIGTDCDGCNSNYHTITLLQGTLFDRILVQMKNKFEDKILLSRLWVILFRTFVRRSFTYNPNNVVFLEKFD